MAVTYADLRFGEIPLGEMKPFEDLEENDAEDGDVMYENVTGPNQPRERTAPPAPPTEPANRIRTGFRAPVPLLVLILLLVSLLFLASTIGLIVKYIELSHQFNHLTQDLQRKEEELSAEKQNLERIREEKEKMVNNLNASLVECDLRSAGEREELSSGINHLNTSLLECQRRDKESTEEKEAAEERLKDICPGDWILFGKKCLRFTKEEGNWVKCDNICKNEDGNLIVVQKEDLKLQDFPFNKTGDFWVGKEFRWDGYYKRYWEWPKDYGDDWEKCWQIRNRNLMRGGCSDMKKCVCERNLVQVAVKKYSGDDSPQLKLWGTSYYCKKKW